MISAIITLAYSFSLFLWIRLICVARHGDVRVGDDSERFETFAKSVIKRAALDSDSNSTHERVDNWI
jgi:hypothetical protein